MMMKRIVFLLIAITFSLPASAQKQGQAWIDSLMQELNASNKRGIKNDTNKINLLNSLSYSYDGMDPDKELRFAQEALALADEAGYKKGKGVAYNNIGNVFENQGNYSEALKNYQAAKAVLLEAGSKELLARALSDIGIVYYRQSKYHDALKNHFEALKAFEELGSKRSMAGCYANIGNVYNALNENDNALKNFLASLKLRQEINDKKGLGISYYSVGLIYSSTNQHAEALKYYGEALRLSIETGDKVGQAYCYGGMAIVHERQKNYDEALKNYNQNLAIEQELGDKDGIATLYVNLGSLYVGLKKYGEGKRCLDMALVLARELGSLERMRDVNENLGTLYAATGDYKRSLEHYKIYIGQRDSVVNKENIQKVRQQEMQYEFDKKSEAVNMELAKKDAIRSEKMKRQQIITYASFIGAGVFLLVAIFAVLAFRQKRKDNQIINALVHKQESTIAERTGELAESNARLAISNKKLVELIQYNAHNVREPLSRVMGLMMINKYMTGEEFNQEVLPKMQQAATDLDNSIKDVIARAEETVDANGHVKKKQA